VNYLTIDKMNRNNKSIRSVFAALLLVSSVAGFYSCEKYQFTPPAVDPSATWHFQTDIQPIFNSNCVTCHGGSRSPDLREGKSYQSLTKGGYVSLPAESSKLYSKISGDSHLSRSTEAERLKILYWITQGAQNN
jgi:hypothetical protein